MAEHPLIKRITSLIEDVKTQLEVINKERVKSRFNPEQFNLLQRILEKFGQVGANLQRMLNYIRLHYPDLTKLPEKQRMEFTNELDSYERILSNNCPICYASFYEKPFHEGPCGHKICEECYARLPVENIDGTKKCPLCRAVGYGKPKKCRKCGLYKL